MKINAKSIRFQFFMAKEGVENVGMLNQCPPPPLMRGRQENVRFSYTDCRFRVDESAVIFKKITYRLHVVADVNMIL